MNYRHSYHAGNFADMVKHVILTLVKQKAAPFRVIDTHAGVGLYDLASEEAGKTGEWQSGIGRIYSATFAPTVADILAPYLTVVRQVNAGAAVAFYRGSPLVARRLMRRGDTLIVNELHLEDQARLAEVFARERDTKILALDGWSALKSLLPPKERRGVVLVDPPFEEPGELQRMLQGLEAAHQRFATGTLLLWYPVKDVKTAAAFRRDVKALGLAKVLSVELLIRRPSDPAMLNGAGLVILNPPYRLERELSTVLPALVEELAQGPGGSFAIDWLSPDPKATP